MRVGAVVIGAAVTLLLAYLLFSLQRGEETKRITAQFDNDAHERIRGIENDLLGQLEVLRGVRAFYDGSNVVDRDEFRLFTASARRRRPNIRAIEWAPVVQDAHRAAHEAAVRAEGFPEYVIHDPGQSLPAAIRPMYVPIVFVEPLSAASRRVLGLDLAVLPGPYATLLGARDSGLVAANPRVRFRSGPDGYDMLVVAAIYAKRPQNTVAWRQENVQGYALGVIDLKGVVRTALSRFRGLHFHILIRDEHGEELYTDATEDLATGFKLDDVIRFANAELSIECIPERGYVSRRRTWAPVMMGLSLLFVLGAILAYVWLLTRRAKRIEKLVKQRTATIREVSRLQRAILSSAPYSIVSTAPDGTIRTFNAAAERLLGYSADEVVERCTPAILHKPEEVVARAAVLTSQLGVPVVPGFDTFVALAKAGEIDVNEWTYVRKDKSEVPVMLSVTALRDDDGEVTGYLGIAEDITIRKQAERELLAAKTSAEHASRTKSQFLANMSHELRTPLNAVIGYSEMLEEDAVASGNKSAVADLQRITGAGRHLLQLINDVLDLSKIEAGRVEIHYEPVSIEKIVGEVTATVSQLISEKGNTLEARCDPEIGTMVTDVTRVRQILFNLLSNAAKFTENGSISVDAQLERGSPDMVVFTVRDTGIGMNDEQRERIFRPFAQADQSTTRKYGGTGLGLAICKEFCQLMNGSISVTSEPDEGSVFTVQLPHVGSPDVDAHLEPDIATTIPDKGGAVLVIDDDPNSHELMQRILTREGYQVVCAQSGEEGLALARARCPTAIVLDVLMPDMDGWDVLAELKADPVLSGVPVVMQSMVEGKPLGYALGAAAYLLKPIDRDQLLTVLGALKKPVEGATALVVEDDADTREMMQRTLAREGWTVTEAENGRVALESLRRSMPDVMLLDLMMPDVDGFEVIEEMRANEAWSRIPVVVVTARELSQEDRARLQGRVQKIIRKGDHSRERLFTEIARVVRMARP